MPYQDHNVLQQWLSLTADELLITDCDGAILMASHAMQQRLPLSKHHDSLHLSSLVINSERHLLAQLITALRRPPDCAIQTSLTLSLNKGQLRPCNVTVQHLANNASGNEELLWMFKPISWARLGPEMIAALVDECQSPLFLIDRQEQITALNRVAERLLGLPPQALLGSPLADALARAGWLGCHSFSDDVSGVLIRDVDAQQTLSWRCLCNPADDPLLLCFDQLPSGAPARHEEQFRALIENIPDAIGRLTPDFRLIYANPALQALCRLPLVEARGRPAREAFGDNAQIDILADLVHEVARSGEPMEEELIHGIDSPAKEQRHFLIQLVPERDHAGRVISVISMGRDITEIRKAERRLANSNRQLRALTNRRESVREQERKLMACEIHDELGQHLTALRMGVSLVRLQFGEHNPGLAEQVERLMGLCDRTIQVVRSIATSLRPAALNMGLYPALEWLINQFCTDHPQIACEFVAHSGEPKLSDAQASTAFRIVQEALTNIARHSGATRAVVSLEQLDENYILDITDNGRGFIPDDVGKHSLGLTGMRERGICLGGELVIFSHPGQGTTVQVTFPANESQESS